MESQIFRKKSLELLEAPEDLSDYVQVTHPSTWMILGAAVILLAGFLIWAAFASFDSFISGAGTATGGKITAVFQDPRAVDEVKTGMTLEIGQMEVPILTVGMNGDGYVTVSGETEGLADGEYDAKIIYKSTQVMDLLFSNS